MIASLAERLRTDTRALHTAAERSLFMRVLLRGEMERPAYAALLRNLQAIYAALEPALARHAAHPQIAPIAPIALPGLARSAALEADLDHWQGADWRVALPLQPAAESYVRRLAEIEATAPGLLLAHAYVRYLGDLSGGQLLSRIVARRFGGDAKAGTAFYDFGDAEQTRASTQAFRQGLGQVSLDAAATEALVAEAADSFRRHTRLFDELAQATGLADA